LFTGILLLKTNRKAIGLVSVITGGACVLDGFSGMIESAALHEITLNVYLYISILWAFWMGVLIYRKPLQ
jgi:hypothetical protein